MSLKHLVSRRTINTVSGFNARILSLYPSYVYRDFSTVTASPSPFFSGRVLLRNPKFLKHVFSFKRYLHSVQDIKLNELSFKPKFNCNDSEEDGNMSEFLSRFVYVMRGKLSDVYQDCDKQTIDSMLLIIVGKVVSEMEKGSPEQMLGASGAAPSQDLSEDLWRTVWEVSNLVLEDMEKERKKEKMKGFLQSEEVKEMCRFAGEIGIRGDMLRELRFKWAHEKMEESEFYASLEKLREEERTQEKEEADAKNYEPMGEEAVMGEEKLKVKSIPKRHGKIRYKIYGLDLSDPKWVEVADKIHETGAIIWPQEPKPINGKSKLVTEKILSLKEEDDPSQLLAEWAELLQPNRVDWLTLLDKLKEKNMQTFFKVAEHLLNEKSFQPNIRDYSVLIDAHATKNQIEDVERILEKMNENGIFPDISASTALVHMYSKAGNFDRTKEAFGRLRSHGFQPDIKVYNSMIMASVNAGQPKLGDSFVREMEARDIKPTEEMYFALLRSFAQLGDVSEAHKIATAMQFAGFQPNLEFYTLLVEAHGRAGQPDQARRNFDQMIKVGFRPDDRVAASLIAAYEKKNLLDEALDILLQLKKDGFEPGLATCTVLVDWLAKLQLVDEAEQLLGKIAEQGEAPPFKIQVSLCDMYARVGNEKKALQVLGVLEAKKEQLGSNDFERVIHGLIAGRFVQEATRVHALMEAQGYSASEQLVVALRASQAFSPKRPTKL
ncbi:pentatricopeptide repeat-containing protein At3g23020 [Ricinus communis]|uniref:pentatricopeptide repeat-containing protein At3g23020 n=1 Tax=Ricinus communis TaxID=3988 RepID=UPI00201A8FBD|nr:pentatricopeptide repeat-containing protein At3g23020 [Ricinus communis]